MSVLCVLVCALVFTPLPVEDAGADVAVVNNVTNACF